MDHSTFAILLLVVAQAFIIAEVFLPSGGAITGLAVVTGLAALYYAFQAWWGDDTVLFWIFLMSSLIVPVFTVSLAMYMLPRTELGRKLLLAAPTSDDVKPYIENENHLKQLVGHVGQADTLLAPSGFVLVDNERHHCVTQGGILIEHKMLVEIVDIRANRLVVRRASSNTLPTSKQSQAAASVRDPSSTQELADGEVGGPRTLIPDNELAMDFEIPESESDLTTTTE